MVEMKFLSFLRVKKVTGGVPTWCFFLPLFSDYTI